MNRSLLKEARDKFHQYLMSSGTLSLSQSMIDGNPQLICSNADKDNRGSREISAHIAQSLNVPLGPKLKAQTLGKEFEKAVTLFLTDCLPIFAGNIDEEGWEIRNFGSSRRADHPANFYPYQHLGALSKLINENSVLATVLGNSYAISPDILITRSCITPEYLQRKVGAPVVDSSVAAYSSFLQNGHSKLKAKNFQSAVHEKYIHALISCKWTMRSDRAQNTRAEALNYLRNRKGRAPHIIVATAEPSVSRIASLALGTGEIDMVYHAFLPELQAAVTELGSEEVKDSLHNLIHGQRLRDISDLPIDLLL